MSDRPNLVALGFMTVQQEPAGWAGYYLLTNAWGRPLEFRLTTAVQPNRVQSVLYGPTLTEYLHADVIGKALFEKTSIKPDLIVTDTPALLGLRSRVEVPVVALRSVSEPGPADARVLSHARSSQGLLLPPQFEADEPVVMGKLEAVDTAVDLAEPFARIKEAMSEARKMGVTGRVA